MFHLYQYNVFYKTTADAGEMRTWLNNFAYSQAIDGTGALSNSRIRPFFLNNAITLNSVYDEFQEKASGGYYQAITLSSEYTGLENKAAKFTVNLRNIKTNLSTCNAYIILGHRSASGVVEVGLQLQKKGNNDYRWVIFYKPLTSGNLLDIGDGFNPSMGTDCEVTVEFIKTGDTLRAQATYGSKVVYRDVNIPNMGGNGIYRMVSLCPKDSNTNPTPNLNCSEYFSGISLKDCYIKRGTETDYSPWRYDAAFNQFAVAFNDQFIEVTPSTETINISYKGRDLNNNLILS